MNRRKKIVIGNWKMNPPMLAEAKLIFSRIKRTVSRLRRTEVIMCPPDIYLAALSKLALRSKINLGVQDVFWEDQGFFTGQISPTMAKNAGAGYAILGHSEKRKLGETNEHVALKLEAVVRDGLVGIVCVGEKERDRDGRFFEELKNQLLASLSRTPRGFFGRSVVIAYEPVWKIGRSDLQAMKPRDVHETSIFIRKVLHDAFGSDAAAVPILYGGSVSADNAASVVWQGGVEGLLVGRESLDPQAFSEILTCVEAGYAKR